MSAAPNPNDALRALPESRDAERGAVSCAMQNPELLPRLQGAIPCAEAIHDPCARAVFDAMLGAQDAGKPRDVVSLSMALNAAGKLEAAGGLAEVIELANFAPLATVEALDHYAGIVRAKWELRQLWRASRALEAASLEPDADPSEVLAKAEQELIAVRGSRREGARSFRELFHVLMETIEARTRGDADAMPMMTGLADLDAKTGGLLPGDVLFILGATSGGKTAMALNIAMNMAMRGKRGAVWSLEMPDEQVAARWLSQLSGVGMKQLRRSALDKGMMQRIGAKSVGDTVRLTGDRLHVYDSPDLTVQQLRGQARGHQLRYGLDFAVVDYTQLMTPERGGSGRNREQEVAQAANGFKAMAKELRIPVIPLAQINKDGEARESQAIEFIADVIVRIVRDKDNRTAVALAKNRDGERGVPLNVSFDPAHCQWT